MSKRLRTVVIGTALLVGAGYVVSLVPKPPETPEQAKQREADKARLAARYVSTAAQRTAWGTALRRAGWNCPDVKKIWWRDDDARGTNAKVMCGPPGPSTDVYQDRIFNTTLRPNGIIEAKQGSLYD